MMVFDLDPGEPAAVLECARVAVALRELLAPLGVESCVKTSGSKGLQVYVPLNVETTYDDRSPSRSRSRSCSSATTATSWSRG